jgi:hypothetical protein
MTIVRTCKKSRHGGDHIVVVIVQVKVYLLLLLGTDKKEGVLMLFRDNVDLVFGKVGLKLFGFIQTASTQRNTSFFV